VPKKAVLSAAVTGLVAQTLPALAVVRARSPVTPTPTERFQLRTRDPCRHPRSRRMGNRSPRIAKKSTSKQIRSPLRPRPSPPPQVDERLNGDGTGLILGINDEILGFILLTIPALVFSQFFYAQKDEGIAAGGENDDSGLSL